MPTGDDLIRLAETRLGEKYCSVRVPKNNSNWHGPWDCAEFASWLVFQVMGELYGCIDNAVDPAVAEAHSGAWARDVEENRLIRSNPVEANHYPGMVLVRKPPLPGFMGHIAITDGYGKTIEAAGKVLGVRRCSVEGRHWDYAARIPGLLYTSTGHIEAVRPLPLLLKWTSPPMAGSLVLKVQEALSRAGMDPGALNGEYGPHTLAAVYAFQSMNALVPDGMVGPKTAKKLGIEWPGTC